MAKEYYLFVQWNQIFTVLLGTVCRIEEVVGMETEYERQKENGFCTAIVDGMSGFVFSNRFGMIHNSAYHTTFFLPSFALYFLFKIL